MSPVPDPILSRIAHAGRGADPEIPPGERWWTALDPDFWRRPEPFDLGLGDRTRIGVTAGVDVVIRTLGACLVGALAAPGGYHPGRLRQLEGDLELYAPFADSGDPSRFFVPPPRGVRVETRRAHWSAFKPRGGDCFDLRYLSPYVPMNPRERGAYQRLRGNRVARVRYWRHREGPSPTIVAIHGFSADLSLVNEWFFALPRFYDMGFDVALFTLPFHGRRQTSLSPFSGHGFFAGGLSRLNEAFGQAVCDFRVLLDHLEARYGVTEVGVGGVSLGGYTSALLACVEPRLRFVIPNVPLVSVPDLVLEWHPLSAVVRMALKATGLPLSALRHLTAVHSPLTYRPLLPRERLFIVGGVGDRLAPPKHSRLLWEHWERCRIHWFPGSHLLHLDKGAYLRHIRHFLHDVDFRRR